jgi:hypothetical protein
VCGALASGQGKLGCVGRELEVVARQVVAIEKEITAPHGHECGRVRTFHRWTLRGRRATPLCAFLSPPRPRLHRKWPPRRLPEHRSGEPPLRDGTDLIVLLVLDVVETDRRKNTC